jgi:hypothetical protein
MSRRAVVEQWVPMVQVKVEKQQKDKVTKAESDRICSNTATDGDPSDARRAGTAQRYQTTKPAPSRFNVVAVNEERTSRERVITVTRT